MKNLVLGAAGALAIACAYAPVTAEPYVDYTPQKGSLKVDSNP